jgi:hypothetical protein
MLPTFTLVKIFLIAVRMLPQKIYICKNFLYKLTDVIKIYTCKNMLYKCKNVFPLQHCRNAPSPGATSSLAIGRMMADKMEIQFNLPQRGNAKLY